MPLDTRRDIAKADAVLKDSWIPDMKPIRIQLKRTKGWRIPANTVKVARPTMWGNPYKVGRDGNQAECVTKYRKMIDGNVWTFPAKVHIQQMLKGKNLACFCGPQDECHADVLLEIANK